MLHRLHLATHDVVEAVVAVDVDKAIANPAPCRHPLLHFILRLERILAAFLLGNKTKQNKLLCLEKQNKMFWVGILMH